MASRQRNLQGWRCVISIGELGEFGIVESVVNRLTRGRDVLLGPGDDAAVVLAPDGRVVATTDVLVEGRHFRRDWSDAYDVGRKAAAQNLADVAAMGARPTALLAGLAMPAGLPASWPGELAAGLRDECDLAGASVAGGDVSAAERVFLGITALGDLAGREPVRRSGARIGDVVAVAGRLGWAVAGLALFEAGRDGPEELLAAHRRPRPPYALGPAAADAGAHAMIDVSDGLTRDLGHVAAASGVRIEVDSTALPVPDPLARVARELGADPLSWVLAGGDDHALAAAFAPDVRPPPDWRVIGRVTEGDGVLVDGEHRRDYGGWDHFAGSFAD